ncbi:MAG: hypothetical protein ABEJ87_03980 [Candidatus Nanohalobium sp.]
MKTVSFRCKNCGEETEEKIMPMKHAVLGAAYKINHKAECCASPEYIDRHGYVENMKKSTMNYLPSITP